MVSSQSLRSSESMGAGVAAFCADSRSSAGTAARSELHFAREFEPALRDALSNESVVVLAGKRRQWPTRIERLATSLRQEGKPVILVLGDYGA